MFWVPGTPQLIFNVLLCNVTSKYPVKGSAFIKLQKLRCFLQNTLELHLNFNIENKLRN